MSKMLLWKYLLIYVFCKTWSTMLILCQNFKVWNCTETKQNSRIVKWGHQDNFKAVHFFYEKILRAQKASKHKTNNFHHPRSLCARKIVALVVQCLLNLVLLVYFCLWVNLRAWNLFVKKINKNKQVWNFPDNLISLYYWPVPLPTRLLIIYLYTLWYIIIFSLLTCTDPFPPV